MARPGTGPMVVGTAAGVLVVAIPRGSAGAVLPLRANLAGAPIAEVTELPAIPLQCAFNLLQAPWLGAQPIPWEPIGSGVKLALDLADKWAVAGGHTAYITQKGAETATPCEVRYRDGLSGPRLELAAGQRYSIRGYFAAHRCTGVLAIEFFSDRGLAVGREEWEIVGDKVGGIALEDYHALRHEFVAPAGATHAEIRIIKKQPAAAKKSFFFFTGIELVALHEQALALDTRHLDATDLARLRRLAAGGCHFVALRWAKPPGAGVIHVTSGSNAAPCGDFPAPAPCTLAATIEQLGAHAIEGTATGEQVAPLWLQVDGAPGAWSPPPPGGGASWSLQFATPPALRDGRPHAIAIVAEDGSVLAEQAQVVIANLAPVARRDNLLLNAFFDQWAGRALKEWEAAPAVGLMPEHFVVNGRNQGPETLGPIVLRLANRLDPEAGLPAGPLLTQSLPPQLIAGDAPLSVRLCGRASRPCELSATLTVTDDAGGEFTFAALVPLWPQWSVLAVELPVTLTRPARAASFALSAAGDGGANTIWLGAAGLGTPGFRMPRGRPEAPAGMDPSSDATGPVNAVLNGDFMVWRNGMVFQAGATRSETANGWFSSAKANNPAVSISLDKLVDRDPARGNPGTEVYGIRIAGKVAKGPVRLETALDPTQLQLQRSYALRFYAKGLAPASMRISRILLVKRGVVTADRTETSVPLAIVARQVPVTFAGAYHEYAIPGLSFDGALPDADSGTVWSYQLVFEFDQEVGCSLARVSVGLPTVVPEADTTGFVGLEDDFIASQVRALKLTEHWDSPRVIRPAPSSRVTDAPPLPTKWQWEGRGSPTVDIVVCVYNAVEEVGACLASIERHTPVPHLVTLVDDCSGHATAEYLRHYAQDKPWVRLIRNPTNLGYTRSANIGMANSTAEWLVLLNSDTLVTPGWLAGLLECAASDPAIKLVGPLSNAATHQSVPETHDARGKWKVNALPPGVSVEEFAAMVQGCSRKRFPRVPLLNGFCTLIERAAVEKLQFLDEATFPIGYGEENDLCVRASKAGFGLAIADHVYVHHVKSASFGDERRSELARKGLDACKAKHPDVDFKELGARMGEEIGLIEMRQALRARLARLWDGGASGGSA